MKEEMLKEKLAEFLKVALEEMEAEKEETTEQKEEKVVVTITSTNTSIEGSGSAMTLLNGVLALSQALNEQGITDEEIVFALAMKKGIK